MREIDLDVDTRSDVSACTSASIAAVVDWTASGNFDRAIPEFIGSRVCVPPSDLDSVAEASEVSDLPAVALRADVVSERAAFHLSGGSIDSRSNSVGSSSPARAKFHVSSHLRATNMGSVSPSQESEHDARVDAADTRQQQPPPLLMAPGDLSGESHDSSQLVESFASPDFPVARDLMMT